VEDEDETCGREQMNSGACRLKSNDEGRVGAEGEDRSEREESKWLIESPTGPPDGSRVGFAVFFEFDEFAFFGWVESERDPRARKQA
jgi:hypothetical protein